MTVDEFKTWLSSQYIGKTPGLKIRALKEGREFLNVDMGDVYPLYDLASLTKIMFTTSYIALSDFDLEEPIALAWPEYPYKEVTLSQVMSHQVGYEWWKPFYKSIKSWDELEQHLIEEKIDEDRRGVYSDLDFFVLGVWLQKKTGQKLETLFTDIKETMRLTRTYFHPRNNSFEEKQDYAPTEDCPWRKKVLQGEVHDDNAWALGGISTHAGLFGTIEDVERFGLFWRKALFEGVPRLSRERAQLFTEKVDGEGFWGLGFMKPSVSKSSAGKTFTESSFGHTGFTGTSFWFDIERDLIAVILSNRVHPNRKNDAFVGLRPEIHDKISAVAFD